MLNAVTRSSHDESIRKMQVAVKFRIRLHNVSLYHVSLSLCHRFCVCVTAIIRTPIAGAVQSISLNSVSHRCASIFGDATSSSSGRECVDTSVNMTQNTKQWKHACTRFHLICSERVAIGRHYNSWHRDSLRPFSLQLLPSSKSNPILSVPSYTFSLDTWESRKTSVCVRHRR